MGLMRYHGGSLLTAFLNQALCSCSHQILICEKKKKKVMLSFLFFNNSGNCSFERVAKYRVAKCRYIYMYIRIYLRRGRGKERDTHHPKMHNGRLW